MRVQVPGEVLRAFGSCLPGLPKLRRGNVEVESIGTGLINHSFRVHCGPQPDFFLQQMNKNVFRSPEAVQENYIHIFQYAGIARKNATKGSAGFRMPSPLFWKPQTTLYKDRKGNYWRGFEFIPEANTFSRAVKSSQARSTAMAFGKFTAEFRDFNPGLLHTVIPGFHDLGLRYQQFEASLHSRNAGRMAKSRQLADELKKRDNYIQFFRFIRDSGQFPLRVMHHDAKISNILFHRKTGHVICLVDFDTVMPGYFFSDLGDMIRSMTPEADENEIVPEKIRFRPAFYEAILNGYLDVLGNYLNDAERKNIHSAGLIMIYMQALRFLTDYLNEDIYYRLDYPEQNYFRACNQLILLQGLESYLRIKYAFFI